MSASVFGRSKEECAVLTMWVDNIDCVSRPTASQVLDVIAGGFGVSTSERTFVFLAHYWEGL